MIVVNRQGLLSRQLAIVLLAGLPFGLLIGCIDELSEESPQSDDCGRFATVDDGSCFCDEGYDWCTNDPQDWDCCSPDELDDAEPCGGHSYQIRGQCRCVSTYDWCSEDPDDVDCCREGDVPDDDVPRSRRCGDNAVDGGTGCHCDAGFEPCSSSPEETDCCPIPDGSTPVCGGNASLRSGTCACDQGYGWCDGSLHNCCAPPPYTNAEFAGLYVDLMCASMTRCCAGPPTQCSALSPLFQQLLDEGNWMVASFERTAVDACFEAHRNADCGSDSYTQPTDCIGLGVGFFDQCPVGDLGACDPFGGEFPQDWCQDPAMCLYGEDENVCVLPCSYGCLPEETCGVLASGQEVCFPPRPLYSGCGEGIGRCQEGLVCLLLEQTGYCFETCFGPAAVCPDGLACTSVTGGGYACYPDTTEREPGVCEIVCDLVADLAVTYCEEGVAPLCVEVAIGAAPALGPFAFLVPSVCKWLAGWICEELRDESPISCADICDRVR